MEGVNERRKRVRNGGIKMGGNEEGKTVSKEERRRGLEVCEGDE